MADNADVPPSVEEPVVQAGDGDFPRSDEPATEAAVAAATSSHGADGLEHGDAQNGGVPDIAAATAAAQAVAARLMAGHAKQTYPVSSGAEHAEVSSDPSKSLPPASARPC